MKKYYWQDLPQEIQNDFFWELMLKLKTAENSDDYVNRHNYKKSLTEWEETINSVE